MRRIMTCVAPLLAMAALAEAETHTIVVDLTSITPETLEVAPGDTIIFDSVCAMRVSTGSECIADGILSGVNAPPFCNGFQWTIPELATAQLPIFGESFNDGCNDNRTAMINVISGQTIAVPGEYATIGDAIAAAESGDRISIAAGAYFEHDLLIDKTITLQGETNPDGSPGVKIDAQQQGRVFELVGGGPQPGEPGLIIMDNLVITGGDVDGNGGGVLISNCSPILRNCLIVENACTGTGGGVHVRRDAQGSSWINAAPDFSRCVIRNNEAQDGGGLYCYGDDFGSGCEPNITGCVINDNTASDGIGGMHHVGGGEATVDDSIICGNFPGQYAGNVEIEGGSCTLSNCVDGDGDGVIDSCEAGDADGILYVPSEYPTLEMAWEELTDGDTIAIAAGTYFLEDLDEEALVAEEMAVSIIGETNADGTPATILDGEGSDFEGIYIQGSDSDEHLMVIEHVHFRRFGGGSGVALTNGSGYIRNCIFEGSYDSSTGLRVGNFQGTVEDCWIIDSTSNFIGGLNFVDWDGHPASDITVTNCIIENNYGSFPWGGGNGGVYFFLGSNSDGDTSIGGTAHFVDCTITGNSGNNGGIDLSPQWDVTLTSTTVCGNETPDQIYGGTWTDAGGNCVEDICDDCSVCPGDLDGNGEVGVDDLLILLSEYGNDCSDGCDSDLNDNGEVDVDDLLNMLSYFGNNC